MSIILTFIDSISLPKLIRNYFFTLPVAAEIQGMGFIFTMIAVQIPLADCT